MAVMMITRSVVAMTCLAAVLAGCGSDEPAAVPTVTVTTTKSHSVYVYKTVTRTVTVTPAPVTTTPSPTPTGDPTAEQAYLDAYKADGNEIDDSEEAADVLRRAQEKCTDYLAYADDATGLYFRWNSQGWELDPLAIEYLCPDLKDEYAIFITGFDDGTYDIGKDLAAGTYQTIDAVSNCYWERTTGGGEIIANNFVTRAADGVTVTIRSSDGSFTSEGCGYWLPK